MSSGRALVVLPADDHVHSQWSWDAVSGSMERTCARAIEIGVPSVAFTEHADVTSWEVPPDVSLPPDWARQIEVIVRSLQQNAKARIDVQSAPGEGSRVTIMFNCEDAAPTS